MSGLRLLWVTPHMPRRHVTAARERWWQLLARLATRHEITLLTLVDPEDVGADGELPPGLSAVHQVPRVPATPDDALALLPRTVRWGYANPAFRAAMARQLAESRYDAVQLEYIELGHLLPAATVPTVLTVHQLGFASAAAQWRAQGGGVGSGAIALYRHLRDLDFELRAAARAHRVITMSPEDAARLRRFVPGLRISVNPVGVDCRDFRPPAVAPPPECDVIFLGHFQHPPNVDAVRFLVHDVLPLLGGSVRLRIIGRGVTADVAALARPGVVEVLGAVPDVRPHLLRARAVAAPVRFGTGMRGKVLEALAMARPVVATALGAEGLGAMSGRELLIADGARDVAAALRRILGDPALAADLGRAGRALVEARFDWDAIADAHDGIYEELIRDPGRLPAIPGDRAAGVARVAARLGRLPAIGVGAALLAQRGARWHLRRFARPHSFADRSRLHPLPSR